MGDLNAHLTQHGADDLRASVRSQLAPEDVERFLLLDGRAQSESALHRLAGPKTRPCTE